MMVVEILAYGFMQKALLAGVAVAVICSFMGTFLVLRRYALFGDGIAHVAFGGISVGLVMGIFPLWTAFVAAILGGLGLQKLRNSAKVSGDAAVAIILVTGLAWGVLLVSASGGFSVDLFSFLFGNILLIGDDDLVLILSVSAVIVTTLIVLNRQFLHLTFNEELAKLSGVNVSLLNYLFVILAAVTVVTSMRLVGILLISALIVIPNISAMMLGKGFKKTVCISMTFSTLSVIVGIILSYYFDLAPSGTIVLIAVSILLLIMSAKSAIFSRKKLKQT